MTRVDATPNLVVLIGPPGAGKSTVGGLLARQLGLDFVDTDHLIEEKLGKKISEIFVEDGEAYFREIEEGIVLEALENREGVIALGGGSVLSEPVQQRLISLARTQEERSTKSVEVIFLDVSIAFAAPRVGFNRERPLLLINPRASWQELMNRRRPIYQRLATRVIDTNDCSPEMVVAHIVNGWGTR